MIQPVEWMETPTNPLLICFSLLQQESIKESIFGEMMNVPCFSRIKILCPLRVVRGQVSISIQRRQSEVKRGKPQKREAEYSQQTPHCII